MRLGFRIEAHHAWGGESAPKLRICVCIQPHLLHGHAGSFFGIAVSVLHPRKEGAVVYTLHRMVLKSVRTDPDQYRKPACDTLQPGSGCESPAHRHAAVRLP